MKTESSNFMSGRGKTKATPLFITLLAVAVLAAGTARATEIAVSDFTVTPDGSTTTSNKVTNVYALNGGTNVLASTGGTNLAYYVTTFTFGATSDVHMIAHFTSDTAGAIPRLGVLIDDDGLLSVYGGGSAPANAKYNLAQNMAGQSVTIIAKLDYNVTRNPLNNTDTLINVWVNPTSASVEGSGTSAGNMYHLWDSVNFGGFKQSILNQSTPGSAGDSSITDTVILTGPDATFARALQIALGSSAVPGGTLIYGK